MTFRQRNGFLRISLYDSLRWSDYVRGRVSHMVAPVGNQVQATNVNPFQKQIDEQARNNAKVAPQDANRTREPDRSRSSAAAQSEESESRLQDKKSFLKALNEDEDRQQARKKERGGLVDITV